MKYNKIPRSFSDADDKLKTKRNISKVVSNKNQIHNIV